MLEIRRRVPGGPWKTVIERPSSMQQAFSFYALFTELGEEAEIWMAGPQGLPSARVWPPDKKQVGREVVSTIGDTARRA